MHEKERQLNFSIYPKRKIALLFLYLGWEYDGLAKQPNLKNTIEEHLLNALMKTKLVESPKSCDFAKCGRTDKGVSGFKQVVTLIVRSTNVSSKYHFWPEGSAQPDLRTKSTVELPYVKMLNGVLPRTIRILAYAPVEKEFSARHDCIERVYTYIFPRALIKDMTLIENACSRLIGEHDFRNFCHIYKDEDKIDMSYIRSVKEAIVEPVDPSSTSNQFDLFKLTIKAKAFLWHQIRCIVAVLYEIGCGNEEPEIIDQLFEVDKIPSRPSYKMANELPLCFFDCTFSNGPLEWEFEQYIISDVITLLQKQWAECQIKATNIKLMLNGLSGMAEIDDQIGRGLDEFIRSEPREKNYVKLAKRQRCKSLAEIREKLATKRRKDDDTGILEIIQ